MQATNKVIERAKFQHILHTEADNPMLITKHEEVKKENATLVAQQVATRHIKHNLVSADWKALQEGDPILKHVLKWVCWNDGRTKADKNARNADHRTLEKYLKTVINPFDAKAYGERQTTTAQESTDAEIRKATASVMISSDQDYWKLVGLSLEQSTAAVDAGQKTVEKIQTDNFEPDFEMELTYFHSQRSESTRQVVKFKEDTGPDEHCCRREEMPERGGTRPKERGRSMVKHQTTSSRQTLERSLAVGYSTLMQCPGSLKRERTPAPSSSTPSRSMPTQSLTQKNMKLKSIVHKVPPKEPEARATSDWQPNRAPPYHSMAKKPEDFMNYIMQS